jgi:hypothetical protein
VKPKTSFEFTVTLPQHSDPAEHVVGVQASSTRELQALAGPHVGFPETNAQHTSGGVHTFDPHEKALPWTVAIPESKPPPPLPPSPLLLLPPPPLLELEPPLDEPELELVPLPVPELLLEVEPPPPLLEPEGPLLDPELELETPVLLEVVRPSAPPSLPPSEDTMPPHPPARAAMTETAAGRTVILKLMSLSA